MENFSTSLQETTAADSFDKEAWAQRKQEERDSVFAMIDSRAKELGISTEALRQYLDLQGRFMRMSANNVLLISAQCPQATELAGFDDWKARNVSINAGEKAITVLEAGSTYTREDGTEGRYTNVAKVFDISQTNAEPKAAPPAHDAAALMRAISAHSPAHIEMVDNLPDGRHTLYQAENNTVFITRGLDADTIFPSVAHDMAMASLCRDGGAQRNNAAAAYAAAYMLCAKYDMDTSRFSVDKLSESFCGMESKDIRDVIGRARNAAENVSYQMEKTLNPQQRTEKNTDAR